MEDSEKIYIRPQFVQDCLNGNLNSIREVLLEIYHNPINNKNDLPSTETNSVHTPKNRLSITINIKDRFLEYYERALIWSCANNHLPVVKYLLTNNDFNRPANVHYRDSVGLMYACQKGHLEIVHYLLTSPDLKDKPSIYTNDCEAFLAACKNGQIKIIEYLTKSKDLKERLDIELLKMQGFKSACSSGNLNTIDYFINNIDPKYKVKVNAHHDIGFILAYKAGSISTIQYLVLNCGLKKSKYIDRQLHLKKHKYPQLNEEILEVFKIQKLYDDTDKFFVNRVEKMKRKI